MYVCVDKIYVNVFVKEEKSSTKENFLCIGEKVDVAVEPKTIDHV